MFPGMGGRGGMNPKQLNQMMRQLGIEVDEVDNVEEVVIRTATKEIVISDAEVTIMTAQGTQTYQIVGNATERPLSGEAAEDEGPAFSEDDVKLVMEQAGVNEEKAREALTAADGAPADAIMNLMGDE